MYMLRPRGGLQTAALGRTAVALHGVMVAPYGDGDIVSHEQRLDVLHERCAHGVVSPPVTINVERSMSPEEDLRTHRLVLVGVRVVGIESQGKSYGSGTVKE